MSATDRPNSAPDLPRIFPPWFDRLQVKYMNPALKPLARYLPGASVITHRGRKSGKAYETIVAAFRKGNVLAIALGHGETDWMKNVLAAGEADVRFIRKTVHITNPRILPAGSPADGLPWLARAQIRRVAVLVADIA